MTMNVEIWEHVNTLDNAHIARIEDKYDDSTGEAVARFIISDQQGIPMDDVTNSDIEENVQSYGTSGDYIESLHDLWQQSLDASDPASSYVHAGNFAGFVYDVIRFDETCYYLPYLNPSDMGGFFVLRQF